MKPASSKQIEFIIRQLKVRQATQDEDFKGADVFLNDLAFGHRKRKIKLSAYEEISIRKREYTESEYEKILQDRCLAEVWLFEFSDAYILCRTEDIKACLLSKKANYVPNKGEPNGAYYIHISQIPHLRIKKP
jgi:hypothetical protein